MLDLLIAFALCAGISAALVWAARRDGVALVWVSLVCGLPYGIAFRSGVRGFDPILGDLISTYESLGALVIVLYCLAGLGTVGLISWYVVERDRIRRYSRRRVDSQAPADPTGGAGQAARPRSRNNARRAVQKAIYAYTVPVED